MYTHKGDRPEHHQLRGFSESIVNVDNLFIRFPGENHCLFGQNVFFREGGQQATCIITEDLDAQKMMIFNFSHHFFIYGETFASHLLSIKFYHP